MKKVFKEYTFGHGSTIRNRIVLAPMTTYSSNNDLTLSNEEELYYKERGKDFGMVITAAVAVNKNAQAFENQISIRDERYLDSMTRLASAIKEGGAKAVIQLHHGGRMNQPGLYPNQDIVSASAVKANRSYTVTPRELKTSEVYDIIDDFCNAIRLSIKAGFDGIELHGANTYLLQQFFSPNSNKRTDEFGGSTLRRMKFAHVLIDRAIAIRKEFKVKNFIIGYRFSPEELERPGITLDDTMMLVNSLAGKDIDYLHISLGDYKQSSIRKKRDIEPIVKKLTSVICNRVPLIASGKIENMDDINDAMEYGYDLVALGLISLSDPHVVSKLENGQEPTKIINEKSLLPTELYNRLKNWGLSERGYEFK